MLLAVWIALGLSFVAVAAAMWVAGVQALRCFRSLRVLRRGLESALTALTASAEKLADHPDWAAKLQPALARLNHSNAQLSVLTAALDEARDSWNRIAAVYPRK